ncbi:MAG TPA: hypothetical protein VEU73_01380 [Gemmatimonadales bacterium]|nr:hypothetical protein [Gemmatimonadales bacterium]
MLVVVVLLVTVAMRVAIVAAVTYLLLPRGAQCPHCGIEMAALENRLLDHWLPALQRRWCLECGWDGVVRRVRRAPMRAPTRSRAPRPTVS